MNKVDSTIFTFDVKVNMTEDGLVPTVDLYNSAVDIGVREASALEQALTDSVRDWLGR